MASEQCIGSYRQKNSKVKSQQTEDGDELPVNCIIDSVRQAVQRHFATSVCERLRHAAWRWAPGGKNMVRSTASCHAALVP